MFSYTSMVADKIVYVFTVILNLLKVFVQEYSDGIILFRLIKIHFLWIPEIDVLNKCWFVSGIKVKGSIIHAEGVSFMCVKV